MIPITTPNFSSFFSFPPISSIVLSHSTPFKTPYLFFSLLDILCFHFKYLNILQKTDPLLTWQLFTLVDLAEQTALVPLHF